MDFNIYVEANRAVVWILICFLALLAAFFAFAGLQEHGTNGWGYFLMAAVCALLAQRVFRYFLQPQLSVTPTDLVIRPFWKRTASWAHADTARLESKTEVITKNARGRRLPVPITVERLHRTDKTGGTQTIVLPGFAGNNADVLAAITQRSGVPVEQRAG